MIVIDTHVWVWWQADPKRLSKRSSACIEKCKVDWSSCHLFVGIFDVGSTRPHTH